jgi:glycosyltransferase involved in cell wall biosynthesis
MRAGKIRIAQITHGMGIGGMERVIADLCRQLDPAAYEPAVYCTHTLGALASELDAIGVPVFYRPIRRRSDHWTRPIRIYRFLREWRPDVVHTQHMGALLDTALVARAARVPVLVHTDHSKRYPEKRRYMLAERMLSHLTDAFCVVSKHTRRELSLFEGIPESRIQVVYNGYDLPSPPRVEDRAEIRASLGIGDGAVLLGSVARLEWQKGHDLLVDAMPHVLSRVPSARAVIVGGGSKEEELRKRIRGLDLDGKVHLVGPRRDALRFLAAIDLFVMTSNFEGMPIALLEAMAMSLPILSTSVGGVPEVVEDGVTGELVDGRDPLRYAEAVVRIITDPEKLTRYGRAGRLRYEKLFRVDTMVRSYDEIYRRHLARHPIR